MKDEVVIENTQEVVEYGQWEACSCCKCPKCSSHIVQYRPIFNVVDSRKTKTEHKCNNCGYSDTDRIYWQNKDKWYKGAYNR